jgi:hypothetical protein
MCLIGNSHPVMPEGRRQAFPLHCRCCCGTSADPVKPEKDNKRDHDQAKRWLVGVALDAVVC